MIEQDLFQPSVPGARFAAHGCAAVLVFTSSGFHRFSRRGQSVLKRTSSPVIRLLTMVLFEARGL
jgi:hypothetical protein